MSKAEAISFDINVRQPYMASVIEDRRLEANPWDITDPYSVVGSIAGGMLPYFSGTSLTSNIASLGSLVFNPFKALSPNVSAQSQAGYYEVCDDEEYKQMGIAVDPFCNPVYGLPVNLLNTDPEDVLDYMLNANHISAETGEATSAKYKEFLEKCVDNIAPLGFYNEEVGGDIREDKCIRGKGYPDMFYIYTVDDSVYQMMQCVLDEEEGACYSENQSADGGGSGGESMNQNLQASPKQPGWFSPVERWYVTDLIHYSGDWGKRRNAISGWSQGDSIDFPVPTGTSVYAPHNGTVAAGSSSCGIIVNTDDGNAYALWHMSESLVSVGDSVRAGQLVGKSGNDPCGGQSTAPHLHYEIKLTDPTMSYGDSLMYWFGFEME
jgi:hypothetical protein